MKKVILLAFFGIIAIGKSTAQRSIEIDTVEVRTQMEEVQEKMMDMMGMLMNDSLFFFIDTTHVSKYEQLGEDLEKPSFQEMRKYMEEFTKFLFEDIDRFKEQIERSPLFKEEEQQQEDKQKKTRKVERI